MELDFKQVHNQQAYQRDEDMQDYEETRTNPYGFFSDTKSAAACSVRVAVRARPLVSKELIESPNIIVKCYDQDNQLVIGKDRAFTFDKVFDIGTRQQDVFEICVKNLVLGCFQGYNATVLAYGQTGSGKTFTMGSGYTIGIREDELGIIPRVIKLIFEEVEKRKNKADIIIKCAFLEIYNEELHDLLDHQAMGPGGVIDRFIQKKEIQIREEKNGNISLYGLREDKVNSAEELAACLDKGSNFRSTASTLMNNCSSRSHAIFTISIEQSIIEDLYKPDGSSSQMPSGAGDQQEEYMVAKFHFVDLAGSERVKRTGATGNTLKEGISINKGLLSLGNVIAALTEEGKKNHVPYRDSKLTRILQDSLGGNSRTSMIACVSPAEFNFEETLNTLKYASRARNIKNAPKVNRDPNSAQIAQLRQQVFDLQRDLQGCKKLLIQNHIEFDSSQMCPQDIPIPGRDSVSGGGYGSHQIQQLEHELKEVKAERSSKEKKIIQLLSQIDALNDQSAQQQIDLFTAKKDRDQYRFNLEHTISILQRRGLYESILAEVKAGSLQSDDPCPNSLLFGNSQSILEEYQSQVESMKKELNDKHQQVKTLQRDNESLVESANRDIKNLELKEQEIERLKRLVAKLQKDNVDIKNEAKRSNFSTKPISSARPQSSEMAGNKKKNSITHTLPGANRISEMNQKWMNEDLNIDITSFNKEFIDNLSQKLTVGMFANPSAHSVLPDDHLALDIEHKEDVDSSDEDEDEPMQDDHEEEVIAVPKDEKEQQLVIESLEETKQEDSMMRTDLHQKEQVIVSLEDEIKKREQFLQLAVEQQKELSQKLVEAMKNEYHKKIQYLQQEQLNMEQERAEQLRKAETMQQKTRVDENFKKKAKELEEKLAIAKAKEREQITMQKQSEMQKQRIKGLESEIEKIKTQKVIMMKQMKEESEKHRKWKQDKVKEIMQIRALNLKQDREIQILKRENKKKEQINKRKQEEINALQKKSKNTKAKHDAAQKERQKKKQIDVQHVQNWIISNTEKLLRFKELQNLLQSKLEQKCLVQAEIEEETGYYAQMNVRREKLEYKGSQLELKQNDDASNFSMQESDELFQIQQEVEQLNLELRAQQENLDSLEGRNDFIEGEITDIKTYLIDFNPSDVEELRLEVNSIEAARTCLSTFFSILLDVNVDKQQLEILNQQQQATVDSLVGEVEQMKQSLEISQLNFQRHIERVDQEHRQKEELLLKFIMENGGAELEQILQAFQNSYAGQQLSTFSLADDSKQKQQKKPNKAQNAKMEIQKNNHQIASQTKFGLSKKLAELERETLDKERRFEAIRHKLEQTNAEKETLKRQFETLKNHVKQQGISEIKNFKSMAQEQVEANGQLITANLQSNAQAAKMHTLRDARNQKKLQKIADNKKQVNEPRVIADEPMDDDEQLDVTPSGSEQKDRKGCELIQNSNTSRNSEANVFTRLNKHARNKSGMGSFSEASMIQHYPPSNSGLVSVDSLNFQEERPSWKCLLTKEQSHQSSIYAIASYGNQFYSTSTKSLKIWNLETMSVVSDIGAHQSYIRCLAVWPERNLLLTASSDKTIILWDQISLTQVATIRGHKEEIRALAVQPESNGKLFSAGKGTQQGGSLLIWDLRKSQSPIEEKEKNLDVFCLKLTKDYLYMGCRNHSVYPIAMQGYETMPALEPPHFDSVTSLALLQDGMMVSGSRDKNLRMWDSPSNQPLQGQQIIEKAHNDHINCLESDIQDRLLYSGSRDGVIKVWKQLRNKLLKQAAAISHLSGPASANGGNSINTICTIDKQCGGTMIAAAGADRAIRIWKYMGSQELNAHDNDEEFEDYLKDGKPDYEMIDEHPSPVKPLQTNDDEFEFEEPVVVGGGFEKHLPSTGAQHPQFMHVQSQRISEEVKNEQNVQKVRNINRSSSGMMVAQNSIQQVNSMVSVIGNKFEARRRERKMQGEISRRHGDV